MSLKVKAFNDDELKKAIKESSPIIKSYIDALKRVSDWWKQMVQDMIRDKNSDSNCIQTGNPTSNTIISEKSEQSAEQIWKWQYIVCAAIKTIDWRVHTWKRHCDCFKIIGELGWISYHFNSDQWFVDNNWNYISREEAFVIATNNGQISEEEWKRNDKCLYSEDLY